MGDKLFISFLASYAQFLSILRVIELAFFVLGMMKNLYHVVLKY
jgi:hypothetical protein